MHPPREAAWCRMPSMPAISYDTCMTPCMVPCWRRLTSTIRPSRSLSQSQAICQAPFTRSQIPMGTIFSSRGAFVAVFERQIGEKTGGNGVRPSERGGVNQPVSSRRGGPQNPCFIPIRDVSRLKKNAASSIPPVFLQLNTNRCPCIMPTAWHPCCLPSPKICTHVILHV